MVGQCHKFEVCLLWSQISSTITTKVWLKLTSQIWGSCRVKFNLYKSFMQVRAGLVFFIDQKQQINYITHINNCILTKQNTFLTCYCNFGKYIQPRQPIELPKDSFGVFNFHSTSSLHIKSIPLSNLTVSLWMITLGFLTGGSTFPFDEIHQKLPQDL